MSQLDGASVLITGGTGSLGKSLVEYLLKETKVRRIAVFSRDELKQQHLRMQFQDNPRLRWFLGDVRDLDRLKRAFHGVDYVIHAAALKQVDTGEYNPMEFVKTNVLGSQNVIDASIDAGVKRVVALSTDKASSPINLYGATKLTADKLFVAANNYSIAYGTTFSVVRYGNVMGSRGSVIPFFQEIAAQGKPLPITDLRMTRFWISIDQAVEFVIDSLEIMRGGELYVPRIPSMRIIDLAAAVAPNATLEEVGMRPGEKLHEEMITQSDSLNTYDCGRYFVIIPNQITRWNLKDWIHHFSAKPVSRNFSYSSDNNTEWLTPNDLSSLIREHVDPNFER